MYKKESKNKYIYCTVIDQYRKIQSIFVALHKRVLTSENELSEKHHSWNLANYASVGRNALQLEEARKTTTEKEICPGLYVLVWVAMAFVCWHWNHYSWKHGHPRSQDVPALHLRSLKIVFAPHGKGEKLSSAGLCARIPDTAARVRHTVHVHWTGSN